MAPREEALEIERTKTAQPHRVLRSAAFHLFASPESRQKAVIRDPTTRARDTEHLVRSPRNRLHLWFPMCGFHRQLLLDSQLSQSECVPEIVAQELVTPASQACVGPIEDQDRGSCSAKLSAGNGPYGNALRRGCRPDTSSELFLCIAFVLAHLPSEPARVILQPCPVN